MTTTRQKHASVTVRIRGALACFTRPEGKAERVSYEVPTPSALRGALRAILGKPEFIWIITSIAVLKPIKWQSFATNELLNKVAPRTVKRWMGDPSTYRPQPGGAGQARHTTNRTGRILRDVDYIVTAYPKVHRADKQSRPTKYKEMFLRRLREGQQFHQPYLGCREYAANITCLTGDEGTPIPVTKDLGTMLYGIVYRENGHNTPVFYRAVMRDGVINTDPFVVLDRKAWGELRCI
jgi:CRISPR-associated protein Cas5d